MKEQYRQQFEKMKAELLKVKKSKDKEKENVLKRQTDELDKIKLELHSTQLAEAERRELQTLKEQLNTLMKQSTFDRAPDKNTQPAPSNTYKIDSCFSGFTNPPVVMKMQVPPSST